MKNIEKQLEFDFMKEDSLIKRIKNKYNESLSFRYCINGGVTGASLGVLGSLLDSFTGAGDYSVPGIIGFMTLSGIGLPLYTLTLYNFLNNKINGETMPIDG